jgi:IS30 family transposase
MALYSRLSLDERKIIKCLLSQGSGINVIARHLNRSSSTISREVRRTMGESDAYYPAIAHLSSQKQQSLRRLGKRKIDFHLGNLIDACLMEQHFSPEQISHYLRRTHDISISHEAIYQYIYHCDDMWKRKRMIKALRRRKKERRRRKGLKEKRGIIPNMVSIHDRPEAANQRQEIGHWEGDLIIGKGHGSAILTLVERMSRYTIIVPLGDKMNSLAVIKACKEELGRLPKELQKSLTYDRGKEMTHHEQLTSTLGIQVYFADPHAPWQRGTNENTNGLIREFFPKGTDFCQYSEDEIRHVEGLLNIRPRKILGFRTPEEVLHVYLRAS